jgi:hypothetical protein
VNGRPKEGTGPRLQIFSPSRLSFPPPLASPTRRDGDGGRQPLFWMTPTAPPLGTPAPMHARRPPRLLFRNPHPSQEPGRRSDPICSQKNVVSWIGSGSLRSFRFSVPIPVAGRFPAASGKMGRVHWEKKKQPRPFPRREMKLNPFIFSGSRRFRGR